MIMVRQVLADVLLVVNAPCAVQVNYQRLVSTSAIDWSVGMHKGGQME